MSDYDLVVVGLGALGSATAWQAARRGLRVLGLEQYQLGHARGASHGDSRIIRLSYHTAAYVRSAAQAYDAWAALEAEAGFPVITAAGGIDVFPPGEGTEPVADYSDSLDAAGVPYELYGPEESARRWPGFAVPDGSVVLQQDRTGIVSAALALATLQRQAAKHGAQLREHARVSAVHEDDAAVTVVVGGERVSADRVVVAADGWANELLEPLGAALPLVTSQEYVVHFAVRPGSHRPGAFPVWIWMGQPSFYGFPAHGEDTVKVGQDAGGAPVDPEAPATLDQEYLDRLVDFVRRTVPGAGPSRRTTRCLYTLTPDRDFVLGPAAGHERVLVAEGAAHGFKFAAWFGAALADLAEHGETALDVAAFTADRGALR